MAVHQNGQVDGAGYILSNDLHCLSVTVAEDELVEAHLEGSGDLAVVHCVHCLLL